MAVSVGTRIGSYEIVGFLGSGGMGEVYRARDARLEREVAIKLLPEAFARDPDRLLRFEREAKTLAALNHPNIAGIYGLEEGAGVRALVLELVEGPTLAERIGNVAGARASVLQVQEALEIARQIADALEAAHNKGIMHRDLKLANIKVTTDGRVKVLDFGLAKALAGDAETDVSNSPTMTVGATQAGVLLGTAAYMSPEQAKGQPVDRRTDIFAFGCVLYEMLTGRRVFPGDVVTEILAGVIKAEPDWTALPADTPPSIRRLLRRCLQKDRHWRPQTAGDLRIEIAEARQEPDATAGLAPAASTRRRERIGWSVAVLVLAAIALTATTFYLRQPVAQPAPEMRVEVNTPPTADPVSFAISPDGQRLVFVASSSNDPSQLWIRPLDAVGAQPLAGTEGATYPFWSPDSRSVGFFAGGKLKRTDLAGGAPQVIADANPGRGGSWSQSSVILFARGNVGPLYRVNSTGGEPVPVTKLEARQASHRYPQFLPDGQRFLYYVQGTPDTQGIYLGSLSSPATKRLVAADTAGLYAPPGWLLFVRQGTLLAQRFDVVEDTLTVDPVTLADPVFSDQNAGAFSVTAAGLVAYRTGAGSRRQLTWYGRSGRTLGTLGNADQSGLASPDLAPDSRRVAVIRTEQGNSDIWLVDAVRASRFTFDANNDSFATWSPDGSRIVFRSNRKGAYDLYQKLSSGAGAEELLIESPQTKVPVDWSPDGRFLLYQVNLENAYDLWVLPLQGDRKPFNFLNGSYEERTGQFSPDGRWVAYVSNESGRHEIYVRPFPGPGGQWQISTAGGIQPRWRPDGRELFYIGPDARLMGVPLTLAGSTLQPGTPVPLFQPRIVGGGTETYARHQYDVASDGRFLINVTTDENASSPITLILNWKPAGQN